MLCCIILYGVGNAENLSVKKSLNVVEIKYLRVKKEEISQKIYEERKDKRINIPY
jgi:hypothetical protein